jgi:hypothetical protein
MRINIPEDENDRDFRRELFKTTVDWDIIAKGMNGSFFVSLMTQQIMTKAEFKVKFPMQKGIYNVTNISITESMFPFPLSTEVLAETRHIGKVVGQKASVHLFTFRMIVDIVKNSG